MMVPFLWMSLILVAMFGGATLKLDKYTDHYRAGLMLWSLRFSQIMTRKFYAAAMDSR